MNRKELPSLVNRDTEPSFHLAAFMRPDIYQWLYEQLCQHIAALWKLCVP